MKCHLNRMARLTLLIPLARSLTKVPNPRLEHTITALMLSPLAAALLGLMTEMLYFMGIINHLQEELLAAIIGSVSILN